MADDTLKPQTTLREYVIRRVLGRGSFGVTYLAEKLVEHLAVAIKEYFPVGIVSRGRDGMTVNVADQMRAAKEEFQTGLDRFLEESRTLRGLDSPHIVHVVDFFEHNGTAYMVMEYEEGGTLDRYLGAHQEPLKESQILSVFVPLLEGLRTIHAKWLLHRDIKPENIYIRKDGSPLLIDFGTARHALSAKHGGMTEFLTPGFAPPEQYDRNADHGPWSDIYAVGATMYYCVTRIQPYEGRLRTRDKDPVISTTQAAPSMYSTELLELIDWMMKPDHTDRPQSVEEVLTCLNKLYDSLEMPAAAATEERSGKSNFGEQGARKTETVNSTEVSKPTVPVGRATGQPRRIRTIVRGTLASTLVAALAAGVGLYLYGGMPAGNSDVAQSWETTEEAGTAEAYRRYLEQYPQTRFADLAKARIETLEKETEAELSSTWKDVQSRGTRRAYSEFMDRYPDSEFAQLARAQMATLDRKAAEISKSWAEAQTTNTISAYREFIDRFPNSELSSRAKEEMEARERSRTAEISESWKRAQSVNTAAAYHEFIDRYPDSEFANQARLKFESIEKQEREIAAAKETMDEAWKEVLTKDNAATYAGFLAEYPGSPYNELARQKLTALLQQRQDKASKQESPAAASQTEEDAGQQPESTGEREEQALPSAQDSLPMLSKLPENTTLLLESGIRNQIIGNTIIGLPGGIAEYYSRSGSIRGKRGVLEIRGKWWIEDHRLCRTYSGMYKEFSKAGCWFQSIEENEIRFFDPETGAPGFTAGLREGNYDGL